MWFEICSIKIMRKYSVIIDSMNRKIYFKTNSHAFKFALVGRKIVKFNLRVNIY